MGGKYIFLSSYLFSLCSWFLRLTIRLLFPYLFLLSITHWPLPLGLFCSYLLSRSLFMATEWHLRWRVLMGKLSPRTCLLCVWSWCAPHRRCNQEFVECFLAREGRSFDQNQSLHIWTLNMQFGREQLGWINSAEALMRVKECWSLGELLSFWLMFWVPVRLWTSFAYFSFYREKFMIERPTPIWATGTGCKIQIQPWM